jgi:hypothetical protein
MDTTMSDADAEATEGEGVIDWRQRWSVSHQPPPLSLHVGYLIVCVLYNLHLAY